MGSFLTAIVLKHWESLLVKKKRRKVNVQEKRNMNKKAFSMGEQDYLHTPSPALVLYYSLILLQVLTTMTRRHEGLIG